MCLPIPPPGRSFSKNDCHSLATGACWEVPLPAPEGQRQLLSHRPEAGAEVCFCPWCRVVRVQGQAAASSVGPPCFRLPSTGPNLETPWRTNNRTLAELSRAACLPGCLVQDIPHWSEEGTFWKGLQSGWGPCSFFSVPILETLHPAPGITGLLSSCQRPSVWSHRDREPGKG